MKKLFGIMLALVLVLSLLSGCSGSTEKIKIGVISFTEHPSLDEIYTSCVAQLAVLGYDDTKVEIDYQNAQGDFSNLNSISQKFVGEGKNLIIAIATPAAQAAAAATSDIPIIFSAITDPVAAELLTDPNAPDGNVTGTSDAIPVASIFELAGKLTPEAKTFGFLYNASEANSMSVIAQAKAYCDANGLVYSESTVTNTGEVTQAALSLITSSDALFVPIDNTVAAAMTNLADLCIANQKPVYVAADSMVADGGLATVGINYTKLGQETAAMAAAVLEGTPISELPVRTLSEFSEVTNPDTMAALGIELPN